ncbi:phage holin family protein [uncultured Deefgea sp.]|uniref:phage holin family protein n=1 Tax=uncultured Deefgea sp. TaxID=1304914 RepID=UPI00259965B6|nr:phage holin family protein [uncultured Deefgea sp.]
MNRRATWRDTVGGLVAARFSLFGLELRDEFDRLAQMIGFAIAAAFLLIMALTFTGLGLLFGFWEYRVFICAAFGGLFLLCGLLAYKQLRQLMHDLITPFPLTSEEFAQDKKLIDAAFHAVTPTKEGA